LIWEEKVEMKYKVVKTNAVENTAMKNKSMKKNVWLYLSVIQAVVLLCIILSNALPARFEARDLSKYLTEEYEDDSYLPAAGYIPDAKTAKIIGSQIIAKMTSTGSFRIGDGALVKYDEENRLWAISKSYLFSYGGVVVIEQDTGKVVYAGFTKF